MLVNFSSAFMDVIVDSMMVIQARKDLKHGSEKLQSFSWIVRGFGGITGAIVSAVMTEYFHPKWCILIYSILGFFIAYSGIMLNKDIDREGLSEMNGFFTDLKKSIKELWEIRKIPEIYKVILFILLRGFLSPSFGEFYYYFIKDIKHWS